MQQTEMYQKMISSMPPLQYEELPWGKTMLLKEGEGYKVRLLEVSPGCRMDLQYNRNRTKYWVIISGAARITIGLQTGELTSLHSAHVPMRAVHRIENPHAALLTVVEIQRGRLLNEEDRVCLDDDHECEQILWRN